MKKIILLTIIVIMLPIVSTLAHADYLEILGHSGFYTDHSRGGAPGVTALTGEFKINLAGFESAAFCVELGTGSENGNALLTTPSQYSNFDGFFQGNYNGLYVAWLMDRYSTGLGYSGYNTDKDIADAAVQLAIWDTLYDYEKASNSYNNRSYYENIIFNNTKTPGDGDVGNGDGVYEEAAWQIAEVYKTSLMAALQDGSLDGDFSGKYKFSIAEITGDDGRHKQNLLVAQAMPEPATMLLFGFGLLGLSALGRKKE